MLRLKENFSVVSRDKETLAEENRQLKQLLGQHGIPWNGTGGVEELVQNPSIGYTSSGSISGTYSPPPPAAHASPNLDQGMNGRSMAQQQTQQGVDYDQQGIDFVLTYGDPSHAYLSPPHQQQQ